MLFIFISIDPAHPIKVTWDQACSFFCCCAGLERELRPPSPWHDISLEPWMHKAFSSNDLSKKLLLKIAFLWARAEPQRIKTAYGFKRLSNSWFCRVVCRQTATGGWSCQDEEANGQEDNTLTCFHHIWGFADGGSLT